MAREGFGVDDEWHNTMAKSNLADYLSEELLLHSPKLSNER